MPPLIADSFKSDPRLQQAKQLLLDTVRDHQKTITAVRPALIEKKESYEAQLQKADNYRGGKLWYPYIGSGIGRGALVELADGSIKYDFIGGIGVHFAHSDPAIIGALIDAATSDLVMQGNLMQNEESFALMKLLVEASGMDHCFFTTSGSMACENGLKLAFQKNYPRYRILAFEHCFMGRTLALSQVTDKAAIRQGLPPQVHVDYLPFYNPHDPEGSTEDALTVLKKYLERYPQEYAIAAMELVQGEGGFHVGSYDFFAPIMELLKKHGIAIFVDEVQTFGRTSALLAYQHFQLNEYVDIASIGKLGQVCATLFRKEYQPAPGLLSQTFIGSSAALHAGLAIARSLQNANYFGREGKNMQLHRRFAERLQAIESRYPQLMTGPYGIGTMVAFTPFQGDAQKVLNFTHALFEAGVISFICGREPTRVRFLLPPGGVTLEDIDAVAIIIEKTLLITAEKSK